MFKHIVKNYSGGGFCEGILGYACWVLYKEQKLIFFQSFGGGKAQGPGARRFLVWRGLSSLSKQPLSCCILTQYKGKTLNSHMVGVTQSKRTSFPKPFARTLIPLMRAEHLLTNHLLKAPSLKAFTLDLVSTWEFLGKKAFRPSIKRIRQSEKQTNKTSQEKKCVLCNRDQPWELLWSQNNKNNKNYDLIISDKWRGKMCVCVCVCMCICIKDLNLSSFLVGSRYLKLKSSKW